MNGPILYLLIFVTVAVVILTEKLEYIVVRRFFKGFIKELEEAEAELNDYYALSILAIAMNDREAYMGLQSMANEKYWPIFFRKMLFTTSLFFLLLTPYMLITTFFVDPNAFSIVLFIAIAYFTARLGFGFVKYGVNAWKNAKEAERNLEKLMQNE